MRKRDKDISRSHTRLMWQLFFLYCGVIFFGMVTITIDNLFINGASWTRLTQYNFKAISIQALCAVAVFQVFTLIRLRPPLTWNSLTRFPSDIFWAMIIFALVTSPLYHLFDTLFTEPGQRDQLWSIALSILFEQALCLGLAILFFTLIRWLLRPYILNFPHKDAIDFPQSSITKPLVISFTSLLIVCVLRPIKYVAYVEHPLEPLSLIVIATSTILYALVLYLLLVWQFRDELRVLIHRILSLLEGDRSWLKRRVPIMSTDELGQLGIAFNTLQEQISHKYLEVEQEIRLAYQVQQKLLPPSQHNLGKYLVAATCRPAKKVGGDLYDILPLDQSRFAVITGDVSGKGMPAALLMSAVLALFRAEVRRGGSAGEVLTRLNRAVVETIQQGSMYITLGIGIIDQESNTLEYASAGHMNPYMLRGGKPTPIPCSTLPLGVDLHQIYQDTKIQLEADDRIVLYTDGVVEAMDQRGNFYGFSRFEEDLSQLDHQNHLMEQVHTLLNNLPTTSDAYDDDRTILLLKVS